MKNFFAAAAVVTSARHAFHPVASFVAPSSSSSSRTSPSTARLSAAATTPGEDVSVPDAETKATSDLEERRRVLKRALLGRLGGGPSSSSSSSSSSSYAGDESPSFDPILADPLTKDPLRASFVGPILGGGSARSGVRLALTSPLDPDRVFGGRTDTYVNLLEPASASVGNEDVVGGAKTTTSPILSSLLAFVPPPLRSIIANVTNSNGGSSGVEYVPMRDLFTSPSVSFAYERGWRQGFAAAGFPGADSEFELANEYFAPVIERNGGVLVDMSCATGLFTRRFAKSEKYSRVIACDYSDSMLVEARRRIRADPDLSSLSTRLDLVRCDVARIPMRSDSVDAFHAGAAMHCWPEIELSLKEIHRVLVPGGRYFATTFLSNYFSQVAGVEKTANGGADVPVNVQAFQYFPSEGFLRDLLVNAGFEESKVSVEVLGRACVIMRCEK